MRSITFMITVMLLVIMTACEQTNPVLNSNEYVESTRVVKSLSKSTTKTIIFGPEVFSRSKGNPTTEERMFSLQGNFKDTQLILTNGNNYKKTKVTSCFVFLNNDTIIRPNDIGKNVDEIQIVVALEQFNLLQVTIAGKPDSYITIKVEGIEEQCPCTVTDIDGNVYQTIQIGDQCWMAENLKVTHYRNGDPIPNVTDDTEWAGLSTGAYCAYDNNESNANTYGYLYNWYTVNDSRNIAPEGWHVPTDEEWKELEIYLGMSQSEADGIQWRGTDEGSKLKEIGIVHWNSPNTGATNESGFCALPGGCCNDSGYFYGMGESACFWSSEESSSRYAWRRSLDYDNSRVHRIYGSKPHGFSLRCVKD